MFNDKFSPDIKVWRRQKEKLANLLIRRHFINLARDLLLAHLYLCRWVACVSVNTLWRLYAQTLIP